MAVFLFFSVLLFSQTLSWYGNYDKAHQTALKQGKPLLVLVVKAKDPSSRNVIRQVLMDQPYISKLKEKVIAVMVTYEREESYPVEMYYTTIFPALFLVDSSTELFLQKALYGEEITPETLKKYLQKLP